MLTFGRADERTSLTVFAPSIGSGLVSGRVDFCRIVDGPARPLAGERITHSGGYLSVLRHLQVLSLFGGCGTADASRGSEAVEEQFYSLMLWRTRCDLNWFSPLWHMFQIGSCLPSWPPGRRGC